MSEAIGFSDKHWNLGWILQTLLFNLMCEFTFYGLWHMMTSKNAKMKPYKYNKENAYDSNDANHLSREVLYTTLGWIQSTVVHCVIMYLWANNKLPYELNFTDQLWFNIGSIALVTYWREFHFYCVHRFMHPWWDVKNGLAQADIGAFLYRHFHSLHHKSYNPGPWSGLSMHPVEHWFLYSCTLPSFFFKLHPLQFLYCKFHLDISPIGGHDGHDSPGGGADFHYLHHALFECNYGVPLIPFDKLFGSWKSYSDYIKEHPELELECKTETKKKKI